jgi:hypothetical protein
MIISIGDPTWSIVSLSELAPSSLDLGQALLGLPNVRRAISLLQAWPG